MIILFFIGYAAFPQNKQIDTLKDSLSLLKGKQKAELCLKIASLYRGKPDSSFVYIEKAKEILHKFPDENLAGKMFLRLGDWHSDKGNIDEGIKNYLEAIKYFERTKDEKNLARANNNIGVVYNQMRNHKLARRYFEQALELKLKMGDSSQIMSAINNVATTYYELNEYEKALAQFRHSLKYAGKNANKTFLSNIYENIGDCYNEMNKLDEAFRNFEIAINYSREINDTNNLVDILINTADLYRGIKKFDKAIYLAKEALEICNRYDIKTNKQFVYNALQETYAAMGDYKNAYGYVYEEMKIKDTIYGIETSENIAEMQAKFDTEKKEQENKILTEENKIKDLEISRNRYVSYGLAGLALLILVIAGLFIRQNKLKAAQRSMQLEQKLLRSQMNPHFIFNSLSAIESFIYTNDPRAAGRYLSSFARLMRMILENSREEFVPLEKEIKTLELYLQLQKLRFEEKFTYSIKVDENIDVENTLIPPMMAQPFIENSIEHGIKNMKGDGLITIGFMSQEKEIIFSVEDNGVGMQRSSEINEQKRKHRSLATTITNERLSLLNQGRKRKIKLNYEDLSDEGNNTYGTRVSFIIPFTES